MKWYFVPRAVLVSALTAILAACATPQSSGRKGLFDGVTQAAQGRYVSSVTRKTTAAKTAAESERVPQLDQQGMTPAVEIATGGLHWPLQRVQITSLFGKRGREFHEGIDLKAAQGTPVYAAQEGTVIYAGQKIHGYGKMVVVRHFRQISTIYAHNSSLLVRTGQYVRLGQKIAMTGSTGHVTGPHLHFEIRDGQAAMDPMAFLPRARTAAAPLGPVAPQPSKLFALSKRARK